MIHGGLEGGVIQWAGGPDVKIDGRGLKTDVAKGMSSNQVGATNTMIKVD